MWAKVSISGYHMIPQEFFSGKFLKCIVRSTFWGRKRRKLTRSVFLIIVLNLSYYPRYNARINMLSEPSPKHCQYQFFDVVQSLSLVWLYATQCTARTPGFATLQIAHSFLKPMIFESVMLCSHLVLCPTLLFLPSIFPNISFFPVILFLIPGGQYTGSSNSASVLPWIVKVYFLHALLVKFHAHHRTVTHLLQTHCGKASVSWHSVLVVLLSPPYITPEN